MRNPKPVRSVTGRLLAGVALLAAGAPAIADEDEIKQLSKPESTGRVGLGYLTDDDRRGGQYNGLSDQKGYLLLDLDYNRRIDETGTWYRGFVRNLGLDNRELRGEVERQGNWRGFIDFNQIPRNEPLIPNTGLTGIGDPVQTLNGTAPRNVFLDTRRDRFGLGFDKELSPALGFKVRYTHETKTGARMFGRGTGDFLTDPIDQRTQQLEATLGYETEKYQLLGGYYGTLFNNKNKVLDVNTGVDIALPPSNDSHQLFLNGGYNFSPATRANFKAAYTRMRQNETFFTAPDFPGNTQTNLDGRMNVTQLQAGITSRASRELTLLANIRYEDRDDKTPRVQFLTPSAGRDGFNTPFSRTTTSAKGEAAYLLPSGIKLIGGLDWEKRKRSTLPVRQASWREENDETTLRFEARRSISETLNGALMLSYADRGGSDFLPANNNVANDLVDPIHFADRKRSKVRLSLDWLPLPALQLQTLLDFAKDDYDVRTLGPESGKATAFALDANYTLSDAWQLYGFASYDDNKINQSTQSSANGTLIPAQNWKAHLRNKGLAYGLGVRGQPMSKLELGADVQWGRDTNVHGLEAIVPPEALLPDIHSQRTTLRFYSNYTLQKNLTLRFDLIYDRFKTNDWTWTNFTYVDGTTVNNPNTNSTFLGVSLVYRMW